MSYPEGYNRSAEFASAALVHMKKCNIPPNPHNFMIWYEYHLGNNQALIKSLEPLVAGKRDFPPTINRQIYDKFFDKSDAAGKQDAWGAHISAVTEQIMRNLDATGRDTETYGQALKNFTGDLEGVDNIDDVKQLVASVLEDTKSMASHMQELQDRVQNSKSEVSQLKDELDRTRRDAMTDGLTGVGNRKCFDSTLKDAIAEAAETNEPLSLVMADLDHFKSFNDTFGHQVGDQVLRIVGRTLTDSVKGRDTAARYGGEEFALVLPNTTQDGAASLAESIRKAISTKKLVKKGSDEDYGTITLSMGVSTYIPGEPSSEFIRRADRALYDAKKLGRNRVLTADSGPPARSARA